MVGFPFLLKWCSAVERVSYCVFLPGPFWELHNPKPMQKGVGGLRSSLSTPGKSPWYILPGCSILLWNHPARASRVASGTASGQRWPPRGCSISHRSPEDIRACSSSTVCRVNVWRVMEAFLPSTASPADFSLGRDNLSPWDLGFNAFTLITTVVRFPSGGKEFCFTATVEQLLIVCTKYISVPKFRLLL